MENNSYRLEIIVNDLFHKILAFVLGLICVGLCITAEIFNNNYFSGWNIVFGLAFVGSIIRLDTMVHRLGKFLEQKSDPWEIFRTKLKYDKLYLTICDIFAVIPVAISLFISYGKLWNPNAFYQIWLITALVLQIVGVILWATAPSQVRKTKAVSIIKD